MVYLYHQEEQRGLEMKEIRNGNKAIRISENNSIMFYGQYYNNDFQVLETKDYTARKLTNFKKKYNF